MATLQDLLDIEGVVASFLIHEPKRHELGAPPRLGVLWRGVDSMHRRRR